MEDEQSYTEATIREQFLNDFEDRRYLESAGSRMLWVDLPEFEQSSDPAPWLEMAEQDGGNDESPIFLAFGAKPSDADTTFSVLEDHAWRMAALRGSIVACVMLARQRTYMGYLEEAFRWVSRASLIISDLSHWRGDLEYAGWTEVDITFWAARERSSLESIKNDSGLKLSLLEPKDILSNRESLDSIGVSYCLTCGFAKSIDQVCDHSLVVPYQSSKGERPSSGLKAQKMADQKGESTLPFCQNCGHEFASKSSKFCPSCGFDRSKP